MDVEQVENLLLFLRTFGSDDVNIEAKRSETKLPESVAETLSAFSNTPDGGILLLGVDESTNFAVTGVADPGKIQADLSSAARDRLTPPLQPVVGMVEVEGKPVVFAEVPELSRDQKPCYITSKGVNRGSYIRIGDGDRRLTSEEVQQLISDRGQPRFDHEVVSDAEISDLDQHGINSLLARVRVSNSRIFVDESDEAVLKMLGVIKRAPDGGMRPTLAGILSLGRYPQQFFPQLCLTFVHYPTNKGESGETSTRFLDNVRIDGPIPQIAREALAVIQRNMSRRALVSGGGRQDVWEYPPEALREAVVNALVHRDLSPGSRGTQVQVEMYPDRLRILNPGGLFGAVDITRLGEEGVSSSRNSLLLKVLEDVTIPGENRTVCENRGSGIRTMRNELARAGMSPPQFHDKVTSFEVIMPNHTLFDEATVRWLGTIGREGLKDTQRTALALMRRNEVLDNAKYRAATGISDSRIATTELQDLVARELVDQTGTRGGARYTLSEYAKSLDGTEGSRRVRPNRRRQILDLLTVHGDLSKAEISTLLNINTKSAEYWLARLRKEGSIQFTEPGKGTKNARYRLTDKAQQSELFDS
ncbi:ATP-binding protein [Micromonospora sp. NPDC051227]|uniref:ATP-binding protein n=1 Tax=Micromonospora sp. NPDC051227 TaxID=3364285 RepID=UPI00378D3C0D